MTTRRSRLHRAGAEIARRFLPGAVEARQTANMTSTPKGSVQESCAPSAELYQSVSRPSRSEHQADADAEHEAGRDEAADHQHRTRAVSPRSARRNARPASNETTTVDDRDQRAPRRDRAVKAPVMSPVSACVKRSMNQCSEQALHRETPARRARPGTTGCRCRPSGRRAPARREAKSAGERVERPGAAAVARYAWRVCADDATLRRRSLRQFLAHVDRAQDQRLTSRTHESVRVTALAAAVRKLQDVEMSS